MQKVSQKNITQFETYFKEQDAVTKLLLHDSEYLSDIELLMAVSGIRKREVIENLMSSVQNLKALSKLSTVSLMRFQGISKINAASISACFALYNRYLNVSQLEQTKISSSLSIRDYMEGTFHNAEVEEFHIMFLNHGHKVITTLKLSKGGISETAVDLRLILKRALELNSTSIVACHNHPSGNNNPSNEDIKVTQKIKNSAKIMDITLLDHLIFTDNSYYSFADEGTL